MVTYQYNIYKSHNTKHLDKILGECCFVWNHALALQKRYYKMFGEYINCIKMEKHFTKRISRCLLHSQTRQEILQRLDNSYKRFFKKISKRPPKFKRSENFSSFVFKQGGYLLNGNRFTIRRDGKVFKFSYSRPYVGKIKQVRVKRLTAHRYALYIVTDHNLGNTYEKSHNGAFVGIDFGLKTYMTLSDGTRYQSPRFFKEYELKIKRASRRLSKAIRGSNNYRKKKFELQQLYRTISNKRDDYQWKLAHELCRKYDYIFFETLNINGMRRLWGKKISDLSHSSFISKLEQVALKYNVAVHHIDKWYPSSKLCECGHKNESLSLKDRQWVCPQCGSINDRDLLASKNILRRGIYELESQSKTSRKTEASDVSIQEFSTFR